MIKPDELKAVPIFACLTDAHRERIAQNAADLDVPAGEWLVREGEVPCFLVLLQGVLDVEKEYGGASRGRGSLVPGDFFGETPILIDSLTIASLRAHEPSRVLRLDRMQFKELIDSSSECSNLIVQVMMRRVTTMRDYVRENNPLRAVVVGSQYDSECHDIRAFLSLNRILYEWVDRERNPERIPAQVPATGACVVVDNSVLVELPLTVRKVAEALGISTMPARKDYDVVVVGGGPAGLAAAVYGASEGLCVLLVEKNAVGGQAGTSSRIENYLGFPNGLSGDELSARALKQATRFGAELVMTRTVQKIEAESGGYCVELDGGTRVQTKTIVLATGVDWRRLEARGIDRLHGKGVLYGAGRTEAATVIGKNVFIVGGGNSAGQAAMFFSSYAASVTVLVRGDSLALTMSQYLIDQLAQRRNISVEPFTTVISVDGKEFLESICTTTNGETARHRAADALFVMIGAQAKTEWLPEELLRDADGFVCSGRDLTGWTQKRSPFLLETNMPGIFCAGDVRHNSVKRVSSGVGEGSMAIAFIHQYLATQQHAHKQ
jgi:thioredoxin reductase (NADPH)